ncbi:MAG: DUF1987 domain-containing protein [Salinivirgaceae bacterium]|jgi:hypothetical protein
MEPIKYSATEDTPEVILDAENNTFRIAERSLPENAFEFYKPIYEWFEKYVESPNRHTELHFQLDYFNTATAKQISKLLTLLEQIKSSLIVKWHYFSDDTDMEENGARYARLTGISFDLIEEEAEEDDELNIIYD